MKRLLLTLICLVLVLPAFGASPSTNFVNLVVTYADFQLTAQGVRKTTLTPLAPFADYGTNTLLSPAPRSQVTSPTGSTTYSNVVSGYAYRLTLETPYTSTIRTCGIPVQVTGTVSAVTYLGDIHAMTFYYLYRTNELLSVAQTNILVANVINSGTMAYSNAAGPTGFQAWVSNAISQNATGGGGGSATNLAAGQNITISSSGGTNIIAFIPATNFLPIINLSARGIRNGLSTITNDGAPWGIDTPNTTTMGFQEAINSIPGPAVIGYGTNTVGACFQFGPGDFYFTTNIYYTNAAVSHVKLQGASFLSSRLIYAGNTQTNFLTFTGGDHPGGTMGIPLHFSARDLTFTSITNGTFALLRVTNQSHLDIEFCNFTGWEITTNTDWGAGVSIPGYPSQPPGLVGIVFGNVADHASFIKNCYFANLAVGVDIWTDHFYGENIKFADIGIYGASLTPGTRWANTTYQSLGAAFIEHGGLDCHIFRTHLYQVNVGVAADHPNGVSAVCPIQIKEPQWETVYTTLAATAAGQLWYLDELAVDGESHNLQSLITHAPYALSAPAPNTLTGVSRAVYNPLLTQQHINGNLNRLTNFGIIQGLFTGNGGGLTNVQGSVSNLNSMFATNPPNPIYQWTASPNIRWRMDSWNVFQDHWGNTNTTTFGTNSLKWWTNTIRWNTTNFLQFGLDTIACTDGWQWYARDSNGDLGWETNIFGTAGLPYMCDFAHSNGHYAFTYTAMYETTCRGYPATHLTNVVRDVKRWMSWGFDGMLVDLCDHSGFVTNNPSYSTAWLRSANQAIADYHMSCAATGGIIRPFFIQQVFSDAVGFPDKLWPDVYYGANSIDISFTNDFSSSFSNVTKVTKTLLRTRPLYGAGHQANSALSLYSGLDLAGIGMNELTNYVNCHVIGNAHFITMMGDRTGVYNADGTGTANSIGWTLGSFLTNSVVNAAWRDRAQITGYIARSNSTLTEVWSRPLGDSLGARNGYSNAVLLVNLNNNNGGSTNITLNVTDFGGYSNTTYLLRDAWRGSIDFLTNAITKSVVSTSSVLYVVSPLTLNTTNYEKLTLQNTETAGDVWTFGPRSGNRVWSTIGAAGTAFLGQNTSTGDRLINNGSGGLIFTTDFFGGSQYNGYLWPSGGWLFGNTAAGFLDPGTFNVAFQSNAIVRFGSFQGNGALLTNYWVKDMIYGSVQNVQLQNGNRYVSPSGISATNLIQLVGMPLPSGGYLSNLTVRCSTNNFSTTNYTFTLLTNNSTVNPVPAPVASLLTGTLLGATGVASTNISGVSCILPTASATVQTFGVMQILNSVANTTQPQTFSWQMEWWHQMFNP